MKIWTWLPPRAPTAIILLQMSENSKSFTLRKFIFSPLAGVWIRVPQHSGQLKHPWISDSSLEMEMTSFIFYGVQTIISGTWLLRKCLAAMEAPREPTEGNVPGTTKPLPQKPACWGNKLAKNPLERSSTQHTSQLSNAQKFIHQLHFAFHFQHAFQLK